MRIVLVEVDYVVLQDINWQLPLSEPACDNERFKFLDKSFLHLLLLEHQEQVVEEEVAVLQFHTELNGDPY